MAKTKDELKTYIDTYIRNNGNNEITGNQMNTILNDMVDSAITGTTGLDFSSLETALSLEESLRISGDTSLETAINNFDQSSLEDEIDDLFTETTSLSVRLSSEISTRTSADSSLTSEVDDLISADSSLEDEIDDVNSSLSTEISTRTSADDSIIDQIPTELNDLDDVYLSPVNDGDFLIYSGTSFINKTSNKLEDFINDGEILGMSGTTLTGFVYIGTDDINSLSTEISNNISTEINNRISADSSLEDEIDDVNSSLSSEISQRVSTVSSLTSEVNNLSSGLSTEINNRISADSSLEDEIDDVNSSLSSEISGYVKTGYTFTNTTNTIINSDANMNLKVQDSNTYTQLNSNGNIISLYGYYDSNNNSKISLGGFNAIILESEVSNKPVRISFEPTTYKIKIDADSGIYYNTTNESAWTTNTLVTKGYVDSADTSLETQISTSNSNISNLETSLSTEISTRISADSSLEDEILSLTGGTSINELNDIGDVTITTPSNGQVLTYQSGEWVNQNVSGGTGSEFTGGTISYLNIDNDLAVNGYVTNAQKENSVAYTSTLKTNYTGFPTDLNINLTNFSNGLILNSKGNGDFTVYYRDKNVVDALGNGSFTSNEGIIEVLNVNGTERVTKISNSAINSYDIIDGYIDETTAINYVLTDTEVTNNVGSFDVDFGTSSNSYHPRHKKCNESECGLIRDKNGKLIKYYWTNDTDITIDLVQSNIGSYSLYWDGTKEIIRTITSGLTLDTFYDGVFQSSESISNWINPAHTLTDFNYTYVVEENDDIIIFVYRYSTTVYATIYNKSNTTKYYSTISTTTSTNASNNQTSVLIKNGNNQLYFWNDNRFYRVYINDNFTTTTTELFNLLTLEMDVIYDNNTKSIYYISGPYSSDSKDIKKYIPPTTAYTASEDAIDPLQLASIIDVKGITDQYDADIAANTTEIASVRSLIVPYTITEVSYPASSTSTLPFDEGYNIEILSGTQIKIQNENDDNIYNITNLNKYICDVMLVGDNFYFYKSQSINRIRYEGNTNSNVVVYSKYDGSGGSVINSESNAYQSLFNHRDKLISYFDGSNHKIYDCKTETLIKTISSSSSYIVVPISDEQYGYWDGSTMYIKKISDDSTIYSHSMAINQKYNLMYNAWNNCLYGASSDISPTYAFNIFNGGSKTVSSNAYSQFFHTENFIYIGQGSNVVKLNVYNRFNKLLGYVNQYQGRAQTISNGKYIAFCDSSDSNKSKVIY